MKGPGTSMRRESGPAELLSVADLEAVFFDFDGVILESSQIKDNAFLQLFANYPQHHERILEHHRRHLGHSRFEKFEWIYGELLGQPLEASARAALGARFSELVGRSMRKCPFVPGARELLAALAGRVDCFLVSGTPQRELETVVADRALDKYFREVRGTPPAKPASFRALVERYRLDPGSVLAIGDGVSDYEAARATGVAFVARETPESHQDWSPHPVVTVASLAELFAPLGLEVEPS